MAVGVRGRRKRLSEWQKLSGRRGKGERRTANTEHRTPNTEHRTPNTQPPPPIPTLVSLRRKQFLIDRAVLEQ